MACQVVECISVRAAAPQRHGDGRSNKQALLSEQKRHKPFCTKGHKGVDAGGCRLMAIGCLMSAKFQCSDGPIATGSTGSIGMHTHDDAMMKAAVS